MKAGTIITRSLPVWGWAALAASWGVAVGGVVYYATGGSSKPAGSPSTGGTVTNPGASTQPGQAAGMTVAGNQAIVTASQNALAYVAGTGKVAGLTYTAPATPGNATDPGFVAALVVFQKWQNSSQGGGGYTAPGATSPTKLNEVGTLDFATVAAVLSAAATM